jgi:1-acyl-sn-glycerol-3-phosphate acyltransferase
VPLIPVAVWGGHRLLTKNRRIRARERFGVPVSFVVGAPLRPVAHEDARSETDRLRVVLEDLVAQAQASYPVDGTKQWWQPLHLGGTAPTPEAAAAADEERDRRRRNARESHSA